MARVSVHWTGISGQLSAQASLGTGDTADLCCDRVKAYTRVKISTKSATSTPLLDFSKFTRERIPFFVFFS